MLTQKELDVAVCGNPNCTDTHADLILNSRCHPGQGVDASYSKEKGCLRVWCHICERFICEIAVASGEDWHLFQRRITDHTG